MATLTLTLAASTDDADLPGDFVGYDDTRTAFNVGAVGGTANANYGQGWRFTSVTIAGGDTVTAAQLKLMKSGNDWKNVSWRLTAIDEDNTATFSSGSPPGARAIVSASVADETLNVNRTSGTVYTYPSTGALQTTLGSAIEAVCNRGGWSSGNALAVVCNSDQDASAYTTFANEQYHSYDSATSASEPQLVITYTPGAGAGSPLPFLPSFAHLIGR